MEVTSQILHAKVMHKRLFPRENGFTYTTCSLAFPLHRMASLADGWRFGVNRAGIISFQEKDHGPRDGSSLTEWIHPILRDWQLNEADGSILLITMPRVFGYVFNPVSFWLCLDRQGGLRAVLSEVHNTYGDAHSYLCAHPDHRRIGREDWITARKLFHVSPFLERNGHYAFRFDYRPEEKRFGVWIDYYNVNGRKQLITAMTGTFEPMNRRTLRRAFWRIPLAPFKVITLIHWQALKLFLKRQKFINRPVPLEPPLSSSDNLTKSSSSGHAPVTSNPLGSIRREDA